MPTPTRQERLDAVRREVNTAIAAERERRTQWLAKIDASHKDAIDAWDLKRQLERDLERERQATSDAITVAYRRTGRAFTEHLGLDLSTEQQREIEIERIEGNRLEANDPGVRRLRAWIDAVCREHGIDARDFVDPTVRDGKAIRSLKRATFAPVQSYATAAIAGHEIGHCLAPEAPPDAKRERTAYGLRCVASEILAWQWLIDHTPVWNQAMRDEMTTCIRTYAPYATPDESAQIDELISDNRFRLARLGASERSLKAVIEEQTK